MGVCNNTRKKNPNNDEDNLVYGHRLSSVGSALVTGNLCYEPNNIDLAMKLHYLRVVYFLDTQAIKGLNPIKLKEGIFIWLNYYYESCGRFRRSEDHNGRPYIKCNDCGVRFVEAESSRTLHQWLDLMEDNASSQRLLVAHNVLGPDLTFSPLVFLQITTLKCGGLALGLSWAHVLGDTFSASTYLNTLSEILNGNKPIYPPNYNKSPPKNNLNPTKTIFSDPLSLCKIGPVGDHWIVPISIEMDTFSFHVRPKQLAQLQMKIFENNSTPSPIQPFEMISSVIWWAISRVKNGPETNIVTIIKKDSISPKENDMTLRNNQKVASIKAGFSVVEARPEKLATLMCNMYEDERAQIANVVEKDPGGSDCIVYGSNLTFVNWEEVGFYGFKLNGIGPKMVNCFVDGVGENGVVLALPSPKDDTNIDGRVVTLILPKSCMVELKEELKEWYLIA
ncbi:unnamed protein product [Amaranthus hypochondriacus]